jgi:hypothetical protein
MIWLDHASETSLIVKNVRELLPSLWPFLPVPSARKGHNVKGAMLVSEVLGPCQTLNLLVP